VPTDKLETTAPTGAVGVSDRQRRWLDAADKAVRQGNDLAAALFRAIAQPNDEERRGSVTG
jgi:hypothetical protein